MIKKNKLSINLNVLPFIFFLFNFLNLVSAASDNYPYSSVNPGAMDSARIKSDNMVFVKGGQLKRPIGGSDTIVLFINNFYISKYETTQMEWDEIMGYNHSRFKNYRRPVERITWYEAIEYCNRKSLIEGLTPVYSINGYYIGINWAAAPIECDWEANGYRLPTEAEWEYAAKGGEKSKGYIFSGGNNDKKVAWHYGNSKMKTHFIGRKTPNELGLYDMSGNVWEYCWDFYDSSYYYAPDTLNNPRGPQSGSNIVIRGGSWYDPDSFSRLSYRTGVFPTTRENYIGFRVVRTRR